MFVSPAFAQAAGGSQQDPYGFMIMMVLIFVVFYFLLIRPQQKKMKEHKEMLGAIRRGDKVVTGGGIVGTVTKVVDDNEVTVEIAPDVKVRVQRALISAVIAKTEPVKPVKKGDADAANNDDGGSGGGGGASGLRKLLGGGLLGGGKK